jgi:hypothetical protein
LPVRSPAGDRSPSIPSPRLDTAQFFGPTCEPRWKGGKRKGSDRQDAAVERKRAYARELYAGTFDHLSTSGAFAVAYAHAKPVLGELLPAMFVGIEAEDSRLLRALYAMGREQPPLLTHGNVAAAVGLTLATTRRRLATLAADKLLRGEDGKPVVDPETGTHIVVEPALLEALPYHDPNDPKFAATPELRRIAVARMMPHSERGAVYRLAPHVQRAFDLLSNGGLFKNEQPSRKGSDVERERSGSSTGRRDPWERSGGRDRELSLAAQPCGQPGGSTGQGRITGAVGPETRQGETCNVVGGAWERVGAATLGDLVHALVDHAAPQRELVTVVLPKPRPLTDDERKAQVRAQLAAHAQKGRGGTPS